MHTIGVIGGSGLYELEGLEQVRSIRVRTPFGDPSDRLVTGVLGQVRLVFLPRHGRGHRLLPGEINARANIWALKKLGVGRIISLSAVGSMREEIAPGDVVLVDQFFDRTRGRLPTFFGRGVAAHVSFADPVCPDLVGHLNAAAREEGAKVHRGGAYLCIEGPAFSTRAESRIFRSWGVDVIGMTNLPEARLAREAEMCYATVALSTDYDCWRNASEAVSVEEVLAVLRRNVALAGRIIARAVQRLSGEPGCGCSRSLAHAIMTNPDLIPSRTRRDLEILIGKYLPPAQRQARRRAARG